MFWVFYNITTRRHIPEYHDLILDVVLKGLNNSVGKSIRSRGTLPLFNFGSPYCVGGTEEYGMRSL